MVCSEKREEDCELGTESDREKLLRCFKVGLYISIIKVLKNMHVILFFMLSTFNCF
jgi:hypothetical protein